MSVTLKMMMVLRQVRDAGSRITRWKLADREAWQFSNELADMHWSMTPQQIYDGFKCGGAQLFGAPVTVK